MMQLKIPCINDPIILKSTITSISIEKMDVFSNLILDLVLQKRGEKGQTFISDDHKSIDIKDNVELFTDYFSEDYYIKSTSTALYKYLNLLIQSNYADEFNEISQMLLSNVEQIIDKSYLDLSYKEIVEPTNLLKLFNLKLNVNIDLPLNNILNFCNFITTISKQNKLFILVNVDSYFDDSQIYNFLSSAYNNEYKILLLGCSAKKYSFSEINYVIIDKDLCLC